MKEQKFRVRKGNRVINGTMARNEKEMRKLGKEMEAMQTQKDLKKIGLVPDPIQ